MQYSKVFLFSLLLLFILPPPPVSGAIAAPSTLQQNLGPIPFDLYHNMNSGTLPNCSPSFTIQACYQSLLQAYRLQGVTGVRFQFGLAGAANSTAILPNGAINEVWVQRVQDFLHDVKQANITNVILTPSFYGWGGDPYQDKTLTELGLGSDPCGTSQTSFRFWRAAPFATYNAAISGDPQWYPHTAVFDRHAYNCSPANPYFVGWNVIIAALANVLEKARLENLIVSELDLTNELDLVEHPLMARMIYDNTYVPYGIDVLSSIRSFMSYSTFDPSRVTYSAWDSRSDFAYTPNYQFFSDVPLNHPNAYYINIMKEDGITAGYG